VYAPEVVLLTTEGDQVPLIAIGAFVETDGNVGAFVPLHIGAIVLKVGTTIVLIVTVPEALELEQPEIVFVITTE
jgi:hypothetical protein